MLIFFCGAPGLSGVTGAAVLGGVVVPVDGVVVGGGVGDVVDISIVLNLYLLS